MGKLAAGTEESDTVKQVKRGDRGMRKIENSGNECLVGGNQFNFKERLTDKMKGSGVTDHRCLQKGSIMVETNFRVYAYTSSKLDLAILSSFTQMMYR